MKITRRGRPTKSSSIVFQAITSVRLDGWVFVSSEGSGGGRGNERMNENFSNVVVKRANFDCMVT
jgi:hypothetical protein